MRNAVKLEFGATFENLRTLVLRTPLICLLQLDPRSVGVSCGYVACQPEPAITPHDLRHAAASLAVSAGANVEAVK